VQVLICLLILMSAVKFLNATFLKKIKHFNLSLVKKLVLI
jgi:hypothetical protein